MKINLSKLNLLENVKDLKKQFLFSNLEDDKKKIIDQHMNGVLGILEKEFSSIKIEKTLRKHINI